MSNKKILERLVKLDNSFKMRGDRLEDIEQAIEDIESSIDDLYCFAIEAARNLDRIKSDIHLIRQELQQQNQNKD